jgi:1-acyl-sn-glycerol-3-phosphate acyltransferase
MGRIFTYIYSTLFWAYLILFFALVPVFALPFSLIFGLKRSFRHFFKAFVKYGLIIFGCFPSVEGLENIPRGKNVILLSNHPSFLDPFLLNAALPGFYNFMILARVLENPYSMMAIKGSGLVVKNSRHSLSGSSAIIRVVKAINEGDSFILFMSERAITDGPIGTINPSNYKVIEDTGAVILPVFIKNGIRASFIREPFRTKVVIGKPLDRQSLLSGKDSAVKQAIEALK